MKGLILTLAAIICLSSHACVSGNHTYRVGEQFTVRLDKEAMGGYTWHMKPDSLVSIVNESEESVPNDSTKLNEYIKIFELKAERPGETKLEFIKKRTFEPDSLIREENHIYKEIKVK